jgi:hypothetical protein
MLKIELGPKTTKEVSKMVRKCVSRFVLSLLVSLFSLVFLNSFCWAPQPNGISPSRGDGADSKENKLPAIPASTPAKQSTTTTSSSNSAPPVTPPPNEGTKKAKMKEVSRTPIKPRKEDNASIEEDAPPKTPKLTKPKAGDNANDGLGYDSTTDTSSSSSSENK